MAKVRPLNPAVDTVDPEPSWFWVIIISGILSGMLLFTVGWFLTLPQSQKDEVFKQIKSASDVFPGMIGLDQSKVFLVMGVDMPPRGSKDDYRGVRTDTMMLVRTDPFGKKVNIVSIPRDSKVRIPDYGVNKINAAFTFGGPELAVATVEETLGIHVDNYIVANIRGVKEVVDALGGIDIFIEKPLRYHDYTAKLHIDLEAGKHHLNGQQAEGYLRFRHDALADIGRIRRQQQFVSAVSARLKDPAVLLSVKPLLTASNKYVLTNMSSQDLIALALFAKDLKKSDYHVSTLPGHPGMSGGVSYWTIDAEAAEAVLNYLIVGIDSETEMGEDPPSVGLLYTEGFSEDLTTYEESLKADGFRVACRRQVKRTGSKVITHNGNMPRRLERQLQRSDRALKDAELIFSPHGATFESNACGSTDYTVILGDDTRQAHQP